MVAVCAARIRMTKMMRKLTTFMKLLTNAWMRNAKKGERKNCKNRLKNIDRNDQKFNNSSQI